jgi:hypothetical protein
MAHRLLDGVRLDVALCEESTECAAKAVQGVSFGNASLLVPVCDHTGEAFFREWVSICILQHRAAF